MNYMNKTVLSFAVLSLMIMNQVMAAPIVNGGFETGTPLGWTPPDDGYGGDPSSTTWALRVTTSQKHSGEYSRQIHHDAQANKTTSFYQNIDVSGGDEVLGFWFRVSLNPNNEQVPSTAGSWARVLLKEPDNGSLIAELVTIGGGVPADETSWNYTTGGWVEYGFNVRDYTALDQLSIVFELETANNYARANNRLFVDDVELVPEPATLGLLLLGGLVLLNRKKSTGAAN